MAEVAGAMFRGEEAGSSQAFLGTPPLWDLHPAGAPGAPTVAGLYSGFSTHSEGGAGLKVASV